MMDIVEITSDGLVLLFKYSYQLKRVSIWQTTMAAVVKMKVNGEKQKNKKKQKAMVKKDGRQEVKRTNRNTLDPNKRRKKR